MTASLRGRRVATTLGSAALPAVFVVLWSTGFVGTKAATEHAEPFAFLAVRFALVTALLLVVALATRAPWPDRTEVGRIAVAGLLLQGVYLGGVTAGLARGVPAGLAALVTGLQPLLTAAVSGPLLGERVTRRQWLGLGLGLAGVALVAWRKVGFSGEALAGLWWVVAGLVGITAGTVYQKRHLGAMDLRTGGVVQYAAAGALAAVLALGLGTVRIEWTGELALALAWLVLVLSVGAIGVLYVLIRRGAASQVASLFYLVPPVTALLAFVAFGETLGVLELAGMAVAVAGVALVNRPPAGARRAPGGTPSRSSLPAR